MSVEAAAGELARVLAAGELAVIPTDTVYGLCCDAANPAAAARLAELKGRPSEKPSAVAFGSCQGALDALPELGARTRAAITALLPGPLTLLLPNPAHRFPAAGGVLLGLRVIDLALLPDRAILLTSANLAGGRDAATLAEVPAELRAAAALAIDGGALPGTPSTVVDLGELESTGGWRIVRQGAFRRAEVERALLGSRR
jgi:L-threonylcarbamoyladenylate synthase